MDWSDFTDEQVLAIHSEARKRWIDSGEQARYGGRLLPMSEFATAYSKMQLLLWAVTKEMYPAYKTPFERFLTEYPVKEPTR